MESGSNKFTVSSPFLASRDKEPITQPGFEEFVFTGFVDVDVTTENDFYVIWVDKKDK